MRSRVKAIESYLQPIVIVLFLMYPGILEIAHDDFGSYSAFWIVVEFALPVVLGFAIGKYWVTALAVSEVVWFFIDLRRGRAYAVHDWNQHRGYEIVAIALFALLAALLIAVGVGLRRRFFPTRGADYVANQFSRVRSLPVFSSPVTMRDLRWVIAGAATLFVASLFTSGITHLLMIGASLTAYFSGWFHVHRRATSRSEEGFVDPSSVAGETPPSDVVDHRQPPTPE